jgi:two-component system, NtrC family, sensor kinase
MRLTRKFLVALTLATLVVLGTNAVLRVQRELAYSDMDMRRDAAFIGSVLGDAVAKTWQMNGQDDARALVAQADLRARSIRVAWLELDAAAPRAWLERADIDALKRGEVLSKRIDRMDGQIGAVFTYVGVKGPGDRRAALELRESLDEEQRYMHTTIWNTVSSTLALLLAFGLAATALGIYFIGRPARLLVEKARRVGAGDLDGRLELRQRDEFGDIGREIDRMVDHLAEARQRTDLEARSRIAALEQLRHADRLATVGRLASGIAHELGTPLNVVSGRAQLVASGELTDDESKDSARIIFEQAKRMTRIIRQLLDFARRGKLSKERVDLGTVAAQCVAMLEPMALKAGVQLSLEPGSGVSSWADAGQIQQIITNLVVNAIQATPKRGSVTVTVERREAVPPADHGGKPGRYLVVRVCDTGSGISPETLGRVFEPFFTTKDVGEGTGLGLSVAYGIAHDHGGWIDVVSKEGAGSEFSIYLPEPGAEPSTPGGNPD